jgi:hypothetical protein
MDKYKSDNSFIFYPIFMSDNPTDPNVNPAPANTETGMPQPNLQPEPSGNKKLAYIATIVTTIGGILTTLGVGYSKSLDKNERLEQEKQAEAKTAFEKERNEWRNKMVEKVNHLKEHHNKEQSQLKEHFNDKIGDLRLEIQHLKTMNQNDQEMKQQLTKINDQLRGMEIKIAQLSIKSAISDKFKSALEMFRSHPKIPEKPPLN